MTGPRTYDPVSGRFLQGDPLALKEPGNSPFVYSNAAPIAWRDSSGYQDNEVLQEISVRTFGTEGHPSLPSDEQTEQLGEVITAAESLPKPPPQGGIRVSVPEGTTKAEAKKRLEAAEQNANRLQMDYRTSTEPKEVAAGIYRSDSGSIQFGPPEKLQPVPYTGGDPASQPHKIPLDTLSTGKDAQLVGFIHSHPSTSEMPSTSPEDVVAAAGIAKKTGLGVVGTFNQASPGAGEILTSIEFISINSSSTARRILRDERKGRLNLSVVTTEELVETYGLGRTTMRFSTSDRIRTPTGFGP